MNDKVQRHMALCQELNDLYSRYGDSFHQTFVEEGLANYAIMTVLEMEKGETNGVLRDHIESGSGSE